MTTWRGTDVAASPTSTRPLKRYEFGLVAALMIFGAVIRATGFTSFDLWFDDAWSASAARVGFSQSLHMLLTAPGYAMAQRLWIMIDPSTTWWAQIPAFVVGILAIPAVWALVRWLRFSPMAACGAALFMTVTPTAVDYSTRVKEYQFDLIVACVLIVLVERIRRRPHNTSYWPLAVASICAIFISASTAVIVVAMWLTTAILVARDRALWRRWLSAVAVAMAGCAAVWWLLLRQLPAVLQVNWKLRGYLVDYSSSYYLKRSIRLMFGGFAHSTLGYPVPQNFYRSGQHGGALAATIVGVAVLAVAILVPLWDSWRQRRVTIGVGASLVLAVAVGLAFVDEVPFGDGRTDIVLYPALAICGCIVLGRVVALASTAFSRPPLLLRAGVIAVLVAGAFFIGASHEAAYPALNLRGLATKIDAHTQPGDVVVVDTFNSFAWCYYQISSCRFELGITPEWPQEFQPISTSSDVIIPRSYRGPYSELAGDLQHDTRLWYVGFYYGTFDAGSPELAPFQVQTGVLQELRTLGWHQPTMTKDDVFLRSKNVYAYLFVKSSAP